MRHGGKSLARNEVSHTGKPVWDKLSSHHVFDIGKERLLRGTASKHL